MVRKRVRTGQKGKGFFGNIWKGLKKAGEVIKDAKLISTGLSLIPHPLGKAAGAITGQLGVGKRKRKRRQRGGAMVQTMDGPRLAYAPVLRL